MKRSRYALKAQQKQPRVLDGSANGGAPPADGTSASGNDHVGDDGDADHASELQRQLDELRHERKSGYGTSLSAFRQRRYKHEVELRAAQAWLRKSFEGAGVASARAALARHSGAAEHLLNKEAKRNRRRRVVDQKRLKRQRQPRVTDGSADGGAPTKDDDSDESPL